MSLLDLFKQSGAPTSTNDRVVGVDIGSSSIKVVELQDRSGVITLTTYGELQLGPYKSKDIGVPVTLGEEEEKQALVDVLRESAVKATQAVFAIPLASSFITTLPITADENVDIDSIIRLEARKYIPLPLTEVALDWAEIQKENDSDSRQILLAAIQNTPLQRYIKLLNAVQFPNTPTEIECFSTIRGINEQARINYAIFDLGATVAKMYIVHNNALQRMYRVSHGAVGFVDKATTLVSSRTEILDLLSSGFAVQQFKDLQNLQKIHFEYYQKIIKEFFNVIRDYEKIFGVPVETVFLTGGGVQIPGFDNHVADIIQKKTVFAQPFNQVAYPAFMDDTLQMIGPTFTTALGAALRYF